jgi:hypothetical protein
MALKDVFPDLFGITCAKNTSVVAQLEFSDGSTKWNVSFARVAYDWEVDIFVSFFRVLYSARVK